MGAWGTAIFSDDLAMDIRSEYNALLAIGEEDSEAERLIIREYSEIIGCGAEDEPVFWYALALAEWNKGRLSPEVKEMALKYIRSGGDLERWNMPGNEKYYQKRIKVIEEFHEKLLSPMPLRKKVRKPTVHHCPWKVGSLLAYHIVHSDVARKYPAYGKYVLLRVIEIKRYPISAILPTKEYNEGMLVGLYGWVGDEIPDAKIVQKLEYIPIIERKPQIFEERLIPVYPEGVSEELKKKIMEGLRRLSVPQTETCVELDWILERGKKADITLLDCDPTYENHVPEFFDTSVLSYSMGGCESLEINFAKAVERYL